MDKVKGSGKYQYIEMEETKKNKYDDQMICKNCEWCTDIHIEDWDDGVGVRECAYCTQYETEVFTDNGCSNGVFMIEEE